MPSILSQQRLKRIAEASKLQIESWKEGVSLVRSANREVGDLVAKATIDRWKLAHVFKQQADKLMNSRPPQYRSAISRYYYAMYHSMRAAAFLFHGGDDHQEHSVLPTKVPQDFDPGTNWQQVLKNARLIRNRADYEPYPKADNAWASAALGLQTDAETLVQRTKVYLRSKGCSV